MVDDVEVEVAILVEVEPAGGQADGGRVRDPRAAGDVLEPRPGVPVEPVRPDAGQEEVDPAVGVEVAGGDAEAARSSPSPNSPVASAERPLAAVDQEGVADPSRPVHGRAEVEVELAVAVGVEGGDGRAEAGSGPADDGLGAIEVGGFDPATTRGQVDCDRRRWERKPGEPGWLRDSPGAWERVDDPGVAAHLAIGRRRRVAWSGRVALGVELLPAADQLRLAVALAGPAVGGLELVQGIDEVGVELEGLRVDLDEPPSLLRTRGPIGPVGVGERAADLVPGVRVARVMLGDEQEVAMGPVEIPELLQDDPAAVMRGKIGRVAGEDRVEQADRLLVSRRGRAARAAIGRRARHRRSRSD